MNNIKNEFPDKRTYIESKVMIVSAPILVGTVGTNGGQGGDSGHGSFTKITLHIESGEMSARVIKGDYSDDIEIKLGGDCEMCSISKMLIELGKQLEYIYELKDDLKKNELPYDPPTTPYVGYEIKKVNLSNRDYDIMRSCDYTDDEVDKINWKGEVMFRKGNVY